MHVRPLALAVRPPPLPWHPTHPPCPPTNTSASPRNTDTHTYTRPPARPPARPRSFVPRHNSTTAAELDAMVAETGFSSMDALIDATVPAAIRRKDGMDMGRYTDGMTENEFLEYFK